MWKYSRMLLPGTRASLASVVQLSIVPWLSSAAG